ncbi:MAG: protein kinase, partial [Myxococcaceae bacterium]
QVLKGLDAVHRQSVVHRDIKPANILVKPLPDGTELAQLADFGIARVVPPMQVTEAGLTQQGVMVGTPGYMAPEQILGEAVDARSDVYAVGVVLHELLTGAKLFTSTNGVDVLMKHVSVAPASPLSAPDDAWLNAVVLKALAKSPEQRFPTAAAFAEALESPPAHQPPARPAGPKVPPPLLSAATPAPVLPQQVSPSRSELHVEAEPLKVPAVSRPELPRESARSSLSAEPLKPATMSRPELARITTPAAESPKLESRPGEPQSALSERARTLVTLMQQWSSSQETSRADAARAIETKLAEWLGQGVLEPLVEVLPLLRARREPGLESVIRSLVVERVGAVVRVDRREVPAGVARLRGR